MASQGTSDGGFFSRLAAPEPTEGPRRRVTRWIRRRFAVGFLVALPLVITIFFARFIFGLLDSWFLPISERVFGVEIPGVGFMLFTLVLFALGILATNILGGRLLDFVERRITHIPLLSPIYQGTRQITEAIQIRGTTDFQKVVLLEFPRAGLKSVGFVTREFSYATAFCEEPCSLVFVPTTPNPTTGFLVALPHRELEVLDISVEQGVKLLISGGLLTPPQLLNTKRVGDSPVDTSPMTPRGGPRGATS
jgi:uncharacterized membrane protein